MEQTRVDRTRPTLVCSLEIKPSAAIQQLVDAVPLLDQVGAVLGVELLAAAGAVAFLHQLHQPVAALFQLRALGRAQRAAVCHRRPPGCMERMSRRRAGCFAGPAIPFSSPPINPLRSSPSASTPTSDVASITGSYTSHPPCGTRRPSGHADLRLLAHEATYDDTP